MPFDKTLPTNTTKIRNYPTVLTDNFAAIQEGDLEFKMWQLNFADRDLVAGAPPPTQDPTRDDDTMILFSKQDTVNAETELFIMNDRVAPNTIQLTEGLNIGSGTTNFILNNFRFGTNATVYNAGNIVKGRASVSSAGVISGASNMSNASRTTNPGIFSIEVDANVLEVGTSYQVMATITSTSNGNSRNILVASKGVPAAATPTTITFRIHQANGTTLFNESFDIIVTGGV